MARGARANDFVDGRARGVRASVPVDERVRVRAVELVDEAARPVRASALVDEISHDRHDFAPGSVVESPVRAAGGFPTLGGGTGWGTHWGAGSCARADMRRRDRVARADASGRSEGGG